VSFPRYPKYKDSGVEWLGEVPAYWEVTSTKRVVQFTTGWTPPTGDDALYEGENRWANISDLGPRVLTETAKRISDQAVQASGASISPLGSLLFSFKLSIGQVSFAGREMYTNEAIATFLPSEYLDLGFAYYALPLLITQNAAENIYGAKLLKQELIRAAKILLPSIHEQGLISDFLDRETGKLDLLIAEQQRLIELLKEKRQAAISHAVTKGLNPDAPMKASRMEWVGEVPAHWEVLRLKQLASHVTSGPRGWSERISDTGVLFVQSGDLTDLLTVDLANAKRVEVDMTAETERTRLADGDVVVCITGAKTGNVAVCEAMPEAAYVNQHLCLVRPTDAILPRFLGAQLNSALGQIHFRLSQYGLKQGLSLEDVKETPVVCPPLEEQRQVLNEIESEMRQSEKLVEQAERAIVLLQERRSALISAAVTGKIDVRGLADLDAEAA
jgi:type I restriction enzyme, S subunit